jgi:hypothetical protein
MANIVISYRREDSKWIADRVFERLESHFGKGNVFMDIDSILIGLDFRKRIQATLERCDVMVALVGPDWIGKEPKGARIFNETDWVRIEIEAALKKDIPLIPLLIDGSSMPKSEELPVSLKDFIFRNSAPIDRDNFRAQMDKVIASIDQHVAQLARPSAAPVPDTAVPKVPPHPAAPPQPQQFAATTELPQAKDLSGLYGNKRFQRLCIATVVFLMLTLLFPIGLNTDNDPLALFGFFSGFAFIICLIWLALMKRSFKKKLRQRNAAL